jgi:hypothetical protein
LNKPGKGLVRRYISRMTGLSRAQVTRLIALQRRTGRVKAAVYERTKFATRYTAADVNLLAYVDKAHGTLSGPATRRILEREYSDYEQAAYVRLASISVAHLYRLRNSSAYRKHNTSYQPTRPTPIPIGKRRKPQPRGEPGFLRIDTVHQGDQQGRKGLYHINAVDEVTQWEIVAATPQISELWLLPVLESILEQFPFVIRGFHSDNGSEFINYNVVRLLDKLRIEQTKSRAHHCGDNGLVETKNGAVIRKHIGFGYIDAKHAEAVESIPPGAPEPLRELPPAVRHTQNPDGSQWQAAAHLLAMGNAVGDVPRVARLREAPPTTRHTGGTGSLRPDPIRYRSRSGDAERQAQTLPELPTETFRVMAAGRASRWSGTPGQAWLIS